MPRNGIEPLTRGFSVLKSKQFTHSYLNKIINISKLNQYIANNYILVAVSQNEVVFGRLGHSLGTKRKGCDFYRFTLPFWEEHENEKEVLSCQKARCFDKEGEPVPEL